MRVYKDVILTSLIEPKFKKKDLDEMDYSSLKFFAEKIFNDSLTEIFGNEVNDLKINKKLKKYENSTFMLNEEINDLLDNSINYNLVVKLINDRSVQNLKWLKSLDSDVDQRENLSLKFPIDLVFITEGITEEILLPIFAKKCGLDFDKKGIHIVSAGGKNKVVKLFYSLSEQLRLPIFVLLDSDAKDNLQQIKPKLRKFDKIHILNSGEIEDILPHSLIIKTLNDHFLNLNSIEENEFVESRMVVNLEEIFKKKGFHEFKKAEFAQLIKSHIDSDEDISSEIKVVISELKSTLNSFDKQNFLNNI